MKRILASAGVLVAVLASSTAVARPATRKASSEEVDMLRYPYREGAVYRVRLVPGVPFVVELPSGESVARVWRDAEYWKADYVRGESRVVIRPLAMDEVLGRKSFIHIETSPSNLRISLRVQAVDDSVDVPAALKVYLTAEPGAQPLQNQVRQAVDAELPLVRRHIAQEERARYDAFKRSLLTSFRDDYEWGGDFAITKVVDNRLQTFVTIPGGSDKAVIQYVDKAGKTEILNYEFDASSGVYTLENKVLRKGEKFRLILGKEKAWIGLK